MKQVRREYTGFTGHRRRPVWPKVLLTLLLVGLLSFGSLFGVVLSGSHDRIQGQPQVMIVLGCQVYPWGPSILLQDRLDEALDYLEEHPDLLVVVSGGQGTDEVTSEAQCMYDYLVEHGVDSRQIIKEEKSSNTYQNLEYSLELLKEQGHQEKLDEVLVVSNGFHLSRVRMLFARVWEGDYTLSTLAAPTSHLPSLFKMYIREPLALVKSFFLDR